MFNFFKNLYDSIVEARKLQAAFELARHLKTHNSDFRNWSYGDLVKHIMDETNPVTLDKKPVKAQNDEQVELSQAA